ncbi:MAG: PDZ domain-containing protein [Acidobacteriota bacterium]
MMRRIHCLPALAAMILLGAPLAAAGTGSRRISRTFDEYRDRVVAVRYELRLADTSDGGAGNKVRGVACGVVTGPGGLVVTTADPFPEPGGNPRQTYVPDRFLVVDTTGKEHLAHAIGLDRDLNLAFLQLASTTAFPTEPLSFAGRAPRPGEEVLLIGLLGEPYGHAPTFSLAHIVSQIDKPWPLFVLDTLVQDLTIGGLIVTTRGEALGMVGEDVLATSPNTPADMASNGNVLSLFASVSQGRRPGYPMLFPFHGLLDRRIANPPPVGADSWTKRGWLGIIMQPLSEELGDYWKVPGQGGVVIGAVMEGSPAEAAGLRVGDVIVEVDHSPVRVREMRDLVGFRDMVQAVEPGREVPLGVFRAGHEQSIPLTLGQRPKTIFLADEQEDENFGLTVKELTFDFIQAMNLPADTRGVYVSEVANAGWADVAGLSVSDVIQKIDGEPVDGLESFKAIMATITGERRGNVLFFIKRGVRTRFVAVKADWDDLP